MKYQITYTASKLVDAKSPKEALETFVAENEAQVQGLNVQMAVQAPSNLQPNK